MKLKVAQLVDRHRLEPGVEERDRQQPLQERRDGVPVDQQAREE